MRIVAGEFGGRPLKAPSGMSTRPTSGRVREAIFSILGSPPEDAVALDLFAGAGTLGLEALSRGAVSVDFVDHAAAAVACLRANIAALAVGSRATVHRRDVLEFLDRAPVRPCWWIFVDPPYRMGLVPSVWERISRRAWLAEGGVCVAEHSRRDPPCFDDALVEIDRRRYGDTEVSLLRPR